MKPIIILLCLMSFIPLALPAPKYKHKSETEIARMTPDQRVDEWCSEQVHHRFDLDDDHGELIQKYIWRDGLAALPRIIEVMGEYDPSHASGRRGHQDERFDAVLMLLTDLDNHIVRLRGYEEGRRALDALGKAVNRMRRAGYGEKDEVEWSKYSRLKFTTTKLEWLKGISLIDDNIKDTLWVRYKILLSNEELLAFSNFLVERDSTYPSWSKMDYMKDYTRINEAGNPLQVHIMKKPERFYEAYLEFKKEKQ
jgi:hypothetical protein